MKATKDNEFIAKFQPELKKGNENKNNLSFLKDSTHKDILINKIQDILKWAYNQKNK